MSDYTPDTDEVKIHYAYPYRDDLKDTKRAEFDRWLAAHDREVAAKAWAEGYDAGLGDGYDPGLGYGPEVSAKNPYKNGEML